MRSLLSIVLVSLAACSSSKPAAAKPPPAQFHTTVPCAEQCGGDVQCFQNCQPISNQVPLPGSVSH